MPSASACLSATARRSAGADVSSLARWSYSNVATVWPFVGRDPRTQAETYGAPYTIACTWISGAGRNRSGAAGTRTDLGGLEYLVKQTYYTEDQRPVFRDMIAAGTHAGTFQEARADKVREVKSYDMSPFGEPDSPDLEVYV